MSRSWLACRAARHSRSLSETGRLHLSLNPAQNESPTNTISTFSLEEVGANTIWLEISNRFENAALQRLAVNISPLWAYRRIPRRSAGAVTDRSLLTRTAHRIGRPQDSEQCYRSFQIKLKRARKHHRSSPIEHLRGHLYLRRPLWAPCGFAAIPTPHLIRPTLRRLLRSPRFWVRVKQTTSDNPTARLCF